MSAVPSNILDFGSWETPAGVPAWVSGGYTQSTDYSTAQQSDGVPDNVVNVPRSDGISWGGALDSAMKTAGDIASTFGKVYQINSQIEGQQFQRKVTESQLGITRAATLGTLEIQKAKVDANSQIELARAQRAVPDALAAARSGSVGFLNVGRVSPVLLILAGAFVAHYFLRGKK